MDYFYVADGFGNNGLVNYYLKSRFKAGENLLVMLMPTSLPLPTR